MTQPIVKMFDIELRDGTHRRFRGRLLGHGSSARPGKPRWFEVYIYREEPGDFILHTVGRSHVEGEVPLVRVINTNSAFEIAERLIVVHRDRVYVPSQSLRALTSAAQWDDDLLEALRELPTMIAIRAAGEQQVA